VVNKYVDNRQGEGEDTDNGGTISEDAEMASDLEDEAEDYCDDNYDEDEEEAYDEDDDDDGLMVRMPSSQIPHPVISSSCCHQLQAPNPLPPTVILPPSRHIFQASVAPSPQVVLKRPGPSLPLRPPSRRADQTIHFRWLALPNFRFDMVYFGDKPPTATAGTNTNLKK
jgi:hypothetical protein